MPMIQLTVPEGVLRPDTRDALRTTLARTLLHWEGAPDNTLFRSLAWSHINEVPAGTFGALGDDQPRFRIDVTVPEGALSERRIAGLAEQATRDVAAAAGIDDLLRIWVLVHEQAEGTWGAAGNIVRFAELKKLAAASAGQPDA
ncbi:MAG: 4-oxalocrotonate tautomerase [Gordonia amarae]